MEKRVTDIKAYYMKRAKTLNVTFNPFLRTHESYGTNEMYSLEAGHFGEVNKGFKQLICSLAKVSAERSSELYGSQKKELMPYSERDLKWR